jgi:hypothetical protein
MIPKKPSSGPDPSQEASLEKDPPASAKTPVDATDAKTCSSISQEETDSEEEDDDDEPYLMFRSNNILFSHQPISAVTESLEVRPVWPAWVLASIPGLGLGHLYARKLHVFFQLLLLSSLAVGYAVHLDSFRVLWFIVVPWGLDLAFAAFHVKQNNRKAQDYKKIQTEIEKQFLDSMKQ